MKIGKKTYRTPLIDYILVTLILLLLAPIVQSAIALGRNESTESVATQANVNGSKLMLSQRYFHGEPFSGGDRPMSLSQLQRAAR